MNKLFTLGLLILLTYSCNDCRRSTSKIISIGGCNKNGKCGVLFEDGVYGHSHYPVVGKVVERNVCNQD